jgi:hypothetical protein
VFISNYGCWWKINYCNVLQIKFVKMSRLSGSIKSGGFIDCYLLKKTCAPQS